MSPALLTVEEAAAALHSTVTVAAIRAAIRAGRLTATKIGRRYYLDEKALRRFAGACHAPASRPASGSAQTMAHGSSSTAASTIGQAIAEKAAADLLRMRSGTTSSGGKKRAG